MPRLYIFMRPLIWHKNWGITKRAQEGVIKKLPKISQKFSFLAEFLGIFYVFLETGIYVMWQLAMHHWWKFWTNRTSFGWVILEKPPRSSQKLHFLLLGKHLKVYNLTTRNGIMMKLTRIMHLNGAFHFAKNLGVTHRA